MVLAILSKTVYNLFISKDRGSLGPFWCSETNKKKHSRNISCPQTYIKPLCYRSVKKNTCSMLLYKFAYYYLGVSRAIWSVCRHLRCQSNELLIGQCRIGQHLGTESVRLLCSCMMNIESNSPNLNYILRYFLIGQI